MDFGITLNFYRFSVFIVSIRYVIVVEYIKKNSNVVYRTKLLKVKYFDHFYFSQE